jgi:transposase-like protein
MQDTCGAESSDGTPCEWDEAERGECPYHGENADPDTRNTLLEDNPEIKEIIIGELQAGATVPEACAEADITKRQYYLWRDKAEEDEDGIFRNFRDETTRARRVASKQDRQRLKDKCIENDDTRTWYKLHHDQYGDTYGEEDRESRDTGGQPFAIPDELINKWQQEA